MPRLLLRPVEPDDLGAVQDVFDGLSARSREQRYLVPMPRLPLSMRQALVDVAPGRHVAWLAVLDGCPVGIGHAVTVGESTVELALEVVDRVQRRGIGSRLLQRVVAAAQRGGATRFRVTVLPQNASVVGALGRLGFPVRVSHGLLEYEGPLEALRRGPSVSWSPARSLPAATPRCHRASPSPGGRAEPA